MNWNAAIERNGQALKRILAMLITKAGGEPTLPRHLHRAILRLLRPAEAAARRLIIIAARDVVVPAQPPRTVSPKAGSVFVRNGKGTGIVLPAGVRPGAILPGLATPRPAPRSLALPLLDPLRGPTCHRRQLTSVPRISFPGLGATLSPVKARSPLSPDDAIDATRLALRLYAIGRALDDLPGHAKRFARWHSGAVAHNKSRGAGLLTRVSPLRPGRPPGSRRQPTHEVHEVLADLHHFAFSALEQFQQKCAAVLRPELRKIKEERRDTS